MDENRSNRADSGPLDDLSPTLRRAVEGIVRDPPPADVASRALAAARQVGLSQPKGEGPQLPWHRRTAWRVLAVAASVAIVAALAWWHWGGRSDQQVVIEPPRTPDVPSHDRPNAPDSQPLPQGPKAPPGDRLPTMWAYDQAARQSDESLEALLDRDARRVLRPDPQPIQAGALLALLRQTL